MFLRQLHVFSFCQDSLGHWCCWQWQHICSHCQLCTLFFQTELVSPRLRFANPTPKLLPFPVSLTSPNWWFLPTLHTKFPLSSSEVVYRNDGGREKKFCTAVAEVLFFLLPCSSQHIRDSYLAQMHCSNDLGLQQIKMRPLMTQNCSRFSFRRGIN